MLSLRLVTVMLNEAQGNIDGESSMENIDRTFTVAYAQRFGIFFSAWQI